MLCIGVAALLTFLQQNVTGPIGDFDPFPLQFPRGEGAVKGGGEWDSWASMQIESVGSHLDAKYSLLQYIVYAKILLSKTNNLSKEGGISCVSGSRGSSWWLCRLLLLQQRILDELSSSLYGLLQVFKEEILHLFGRPESIISYWGSMLYDGEDLQIATVVQLEAGILEYKYGRVDSSRLHLICAQELCGMHLSVTGVLGFRRIHQVEATSQRVLVTNTDQHKHNGQSFAKSSVLQSDSSASEEKNDPRSGRHHEYCDVLLTPRLLENGNANVPNEIVGNTAKDASLNEIQQAVVLAQCLSLSRSSREDELSSWDMAPYIEAIDAQHHSCHIIQNSCDILRIRWESSRNCTRERAFLMMDKLVAVVYDPSPVAAVRIQLAFAVEIPTIPAMRKDYALHCISCGMIPEALKIIEDLELWNALIDCYCFLGKKATALDLIKRRLLDKPTDARSWCLLGDVTKNHTYYEKALEVSNNKSARAKRGLARCAYDRGDFRASKIYWESAMAANSLFPDGWFALGAAALQDRDLDKALDGFTRAVQIDPEHGEAWNNIAYIHFIRKKSKPAFIAFREALKFRRSSWQLWENFSNVAFDIGNFQQALEAEKMVLDLSSNKRVDVDLLDKIISIVEERTSNVVSSFNDHDSSSHSTSETKTLRVLLGNILKQIIGSGGGEVWGLYARWLKIEGELLMCSEALQKHVRSYKGSEVWHDQEQFKKFAHASLQLCKVYMEIALSTGSRKELSIAEMDLRSTLKQAGNFTATKEFKDLQSCHEELKKLLGQ